MVYLQTQFEQAWQMAVLHVLPTKGHSGVFVVDNNADDDAAWDGSVRQVMDVLTRRRRRKRKSEEEAEQEATEVK